MISKKIKNFKKNNYNKKFQFIAISDWLKNKAEKSCVLKDYKIKRIYNNIDTRDFEVISKDIARSTLKISTTKQIILYGAQNPQSMRKGWNIFIETLKKLDKSKYFLLIFGNFWSHKTLDNIGVEYKNLGFINNKKILNATYSSADIFVASSIEEAFGKTFAEAMLCETPVVCFNNTSISELVDHKINGFVVKNFNSDELKEGIVWSLNDIKNNKYKKNTARAKIINLDAKVIAKEYIDLYKNSLNDI